MKGVTELLRRHEAPIGTICFFGWMVAMAHHQWLPAAVFFAIGAFSSTQGKTNV